MGPGFRPTARLPDRPFGAVIGVLQTVLEMMELGATAHTDRNISWPITYGPLRIEVSPPSGPHLGRNGAAADRRAAVAHGPRRS